MTDLTGFEPNLEAIAGYGADLVVIMYDPGDVISGLEAIGISVYGGVNAPYVWLKTPGGKTSWDFFDELLQKAHLVGTPGSGFGASGEGYFRLSAFNSRESVEEAVKRLEPGHFSGPVQEGQILRIIHLVARRKQRTPSLGEARPRLVASLIAARRLKAEESVRRAILAEQKIEVMP